MPLRRGAHVAGWELADQYNAGEPKPDNAFRDDCRCWLGFLCEQFFECVVDELRVHGVEATTGEMPPGARDNPQLRPGHVGDLPLVVLGREVAVLLRRQHDRQRAVRPERFLDASETRAVADVRVLPGPQHGEEVVHVAIDEQALPEADEEVFQGAAADRLPFVDFLSVELLGESPTGVDPRHRTQPDYRLLVVPAVVETSVRREGRLDALEKNDVMQAGLRRTAEGEYPLDHVGVTDRPLIGLPGSHRPARDEFQSLDAELLGNQTVL